ncbi:MAG: alpha-galactosidase [Clostridiales bacterium]|jgi:alpha-galactosidase|nr:alpha-galactosidase [Clostridiales bacterium]
MGIKFYENSRIFKLDTPKSTYMIGIVDEENFIGHIYYGRKVIDADLSYMMRLHGSSDVPTKNSRDRVTFMDSMPMEYPTHGVGDFRESCLSVKDHAGHSACSLSYISHRIYHGKQKLPGLPATFAREDECTTLELICEDKALQLQVTLVYNVFEKLDAITRSVKIYNSSKNPIYLTKVLSACLDMDNRDYDMITLYGLWSRERMINRRRITDGKQLISSLRGVSSHQEQPFMAILDKNADEDHGEVFALNLVYSGNFMAQAEITQFTMLRAVIGINPVDFCWKLDSEESFTSPEAVMVYSNEGIGGMTRTFHDLYRNHLIRGQYKDKKRPILINNWEATYFDFDTDKLLSIAREASKLGIEMLVMDDGWFGYRNDDNTSLGDWVVNESKIKGGLKHLVDEVNKLGMKFGIWFEPEMISPDSDLYRTHPDWAIQIPGRNPALARNQLVLDISRKEVRDAVYDSMYKILSEANIEYVKWDMNRPLTDIAGASLDSDTQGEFYHRYVLGLYEMQERLVSDFPHILLENCSSGGGRFDPGMLYYSPQIWSSDNTDAIDRLRIQEGTAMIYPLSAMGAHVADCPSHSNGRVTPFETRGYVSLAGTFGYELDITKIPEEDRNMIPKQVAMYHKYNDLVRTGDYYRIASYQMNHEYDCYEVVSKDKKEALVTYIQVSGRPNYRTRRIRLKGLKEDAIYRIEETGEELSGGALMYAGINIENMWGDYLGKLIHIVEI